MASKRFKTVRKRNGVSASYKGNGRKRAARHVSVRGREQQKAAFFASHSLEKLVQLQGVKPLEDISVLAGGFPADEDIDAFLGDIYERRETA